MSETRTSNGMFKKGVSGNPAGRPKKGTTIVDTFRANPQCETVIEKLIGIASTLGTKTQHPDAMACTKLVVERIVPALKSSEMKIQSDDSSGFVFLPKQENSEQS